MRCFEVSTYDSNDDPGKDGDWAIVALVDEPLLAECLSRLYQSGYCSMSIDVIDMDSGERLPEENWPTPTYMA